MRVKQALLLVGGKGTRLGSLTASTPKPLLEITPNLRFVDVLIDELARQGFNDIVLLAGHLGGQFEARYHNAERRGARLSVVCEPHPAGTGGALLQVADRLDPWFVLLNGDTLFEINLREFVAKVPEQALGRLALRRSADAERFGAVELDGQLISAFREKVSHAGQPGLINGGIYLLSREIVSRIQSPSSIERDVFPSLASGGQLEGRVFDGYFLDMGLPETYQQAVSEVPARRLRCAAFLDRDGILNADTGYTHLPESLSWQPGARAAVRALNESNHYVIVVTNQAGIGRGIYDEAAMHRFHDHMQDELAEIGAHIDAFYFCPYHPEATLPQYRHPDHPDRKPNPGMIERALQDWPIRKAGSFLIGDRPSDVDAARRAGLPGHPHTDGDLEVAVRHIIDGLAS